MQLEKTKEVSSQSLFIPHYSEFHVWGWKCSLSSDTII